MPNRAPASCETVIPDAVFDLSGDAFAIVDEAGNVLRINASAERMFKYRNDEIAGQPVDRLFASFTPGLLEAGAAEQRPGSHSVRRVRGRCRDGAELSFDLAVEQIPTAAETVTLLCARNPRSADQGGSDGAKESPFGGFAYGTRDRASDVSSLSDHAAALQESENTLNAIVDSTTAMIYIKDIEGRYLLINRHFEDVFGVSNDELRGRTDYDTFPRDVAESVRANDKLVREAGSPVEFEEVVPHPDGPHTYISIKFPLRRASGAIYAVCGISTDITQRKRAESESENTKRSLERLVDERTAKLRDTNRRLQEEIAEREETASQLQRLIDTAREGVWVIDEAGCTTFANPRMAEILGCDASEMIGRSMFDFIAEERQAEAAENLERRRRGISEDHDFEFQRKDGSRVWTLLSTSPVHDMNGKMIGALAMVTDITERKHAEEYQSLLLQELDHRAKNTLATVAALSDLTMAGASNIAEFTTVFDGRIQAMARTHEALARAKWKGVPFEELATLVLAAFRAGDASRISVNGHSGRIPPLAITPLALTLNELGTNALKHGALSDSRGAVRLEWEIERGKSLSLTWRESGGPPVTARRPTGTGLQLIRGLIEYELDGTLSLDFAAEGLVCRVTIPMTKATKAK